MNKHRSAERIFCRVAMAVSILAYLLLVALLCAVSNHSFKEARSSVSRAVTMSFSQQELFVAKTEPVPVSPATADELPLVQSVPDVVEVMQKTILDNGVTEEAPSGEVDKEPVLGGDAVTQSASSTTASAAGRDELCEWVRRQIEREKYYPVAAQNAGYEGSFTVQVHVGTDGKVVSAAVVDGTGHMLLRRSLTKILDRLIGRDSETRPIEPTELRFEFVFQLK